MEYIEPIGDVDVEKLCNTLENFKTIPSHKVTFDSYIDRVKTHWYNNWPDQEEDWNWLEDLTEYLDENHSFCHGDASIDNFISSWNQDIVMIDPIYEKELWSSWLLDVSKLQMSLRRFEGVTDRYDYVLDRFKEYPMIELELTHWIRFYKYTDQKEKCLEVIDELFGWL